MLRSNKATELLTAEDSSNKTASPVLVNGDITKYPFDNSLACPFKMTDASMVPAFTIPTSSTLHCLQTRSILAPNTRRDSTFVLTPRPCRHAKLFFRTLALSSASVSPTRPPSDFSPSVKNSSTVLTSTAPSSLPTPNAAVKVAPELTSGAVDLENPSTRHALEILYETAKTEEKSGHVDDALNLYNTLVTLHPTNGRAWVRYATLLHQQGDTHGARSVLKNALTHNPANAILWQTWADFEKLDGNYATARRLFSRAQNSNRHLASVYHSWGAMEYKLGNIPDARRLYVQGLKSCPTSTRLYHALGILEDKTGNSDVARIIFTKGLKVESDNAHLHHALGVLEYRAGKIPAARECFSRAIRVDPRHTLSWLSFALLEEFEGNRDLARKYYAKGAAISSRSAVQIWQAWARMEEKAGDITRALELYKKAVNKYPQDAMLYCSWGKLVENRGDIDKARQLFVQGLRIDQTKAYLWQSLALLEQRQFDLPRAREIFLNGVEQSKGKETAALIHAWAAMEWEDGAIEKARELFKQAVSVDGNCAWLWLWFARFELSQDNISIARHYISRSINLDPTDGSPWRVWAELERSAGDEDRAKFMFKRAAELESSRELFQADPESPLKRPWRKL